MKNYIKKQNLLGLLLVIGSVATNGINNASQTPANIHEEFYMLIECAILNPNGSWLRPGGWSCGKYFLPLSEDKSNFKKFIEATDFSEEGQQLVFEFAKEYGPYVSARSIPSNPIYNSIYNFDAKEIKQKRRELALLLNDQIPTKASTSYHNSFLRRATGYAYYNENPDNFLEESTFKESLKGIGEQDRENVIQTVTRRMHQIQSLKKNKGKVVKLFFYGT